MSWGVLFRIRQDIKGSLWFFPLIGALWMFILFGNLIGLVPGFISPNDTLKTNIGIALLVFFLTHYFGVREHGLGVLVERVYATLQVVARIQVVVRCPLEEFATGGPDEAVVVRDDADVAWLAHVADPGVLCLVVTAYLGGPVSGGVVRDNQLEVLVTLAEQGLDSFG